MLNKFITQSVKRGIERLDERGPKNWRSKVSADLIDQKTGYPNGPVHMGCVLLQVFGSFEKGLVALGITRRQAAHYGFDAPTLLNWRSVLYGSKKIYELQTTEWRRVLKPPVPIPAYEGPTLAERPALNLAA